MRGTTAAAQFDDYFFLSPYPVRFGLEGADPAVGAQLAALRDSGAVVQLWGEVTCPAVDYYGAQITVRRIETVMEAPIRPEGYEGWLAYQNATHTYTLWHPEDWTMLGTNLDESVTFQGPLIDDEVWPVVTISHPNTPLYRPPPGMDLQAWYEAKGVHYDSPAVLAGLPALRTSHPGGAGSYGSDQFALIRGEQLLTVGFLHTGGREDWALYDKLLTSFSFPQ